MGSTKVLIADDHEVIRTGVRLLLDTDGFEVVAEATNGQIAIDLTAEHSPDIVIMDVDMPQLDGIEATRRLKEAHPEARVLILSAESRETLTEEVQAAGAAGLVDKYSCVEELPRALGALLNGQNWFPVRV